MPELDDCDEKIRECIRTLEMVRIRPTMFLGRAEPEAFVIFLSGFQAACDIFGITLGLASSVYEDVLLARGWNKYGNVQPISAQMRQRGLDDTAVLNELINIEIDILKAQLTTN